MTSRMIPVRSLQQPAKLLHELSLSSPDMFFSLWKQSVTVCATNR